MQQACPGLSQINHPYLYHAPPPPMQAFIEEVRSHEGQIEAVKAKGEAVKAQGSTEDKKMVDRWVGDLLKRYDDLNFTLDEKNVWRLQ